MDTTLAIGEYPSVSLREARDKRDELEAMIASGQDPRSSSEPEASVTFREVAEEWFKGKGERVAPRLY